jgi:solute carrier family 25 phosphate transporter 3
MDVLISKAVSKLRVPLSERIRRAYSEIGFLGLWKGIGVRMTKIGTLTGLQWGLYDLIKLVFDSQTGLSRYV